MNALVQQPPPYPYVLPDSKGTGMPGTKTKFSPCSREPSSAHVSSAKGAAVTTMHSAPVAFKAAMSFRIVSVTPSSTK